MEWWNWATLGLASFGAVLGVRAERARSSDRWTAVTKAYAEAHLLIRPLLSKILALPVRMPTDLSNDTLALAIAQMDDLESSLQKITPLVAVAMPHLIPSIDELIQGIDLLRDSVADQLHIGPLQVVEAFELVYGGAKLLTLFEEYRGAMLKTPKTPNLRGNAQFNELLQRNRAFAHRRIFIQHTKRDA